MKKKLIAFCEVTPDGNFINFIDKVKFVTALIVNFAGCKIKLTIEKIYPDKTKQQTAYYFAVVIPFCIQGIEETWGEKFTLNQAHLMLKENFLYYTKVNEHTGEIIKIPKSLSECDIIETIDYIESCIKFIGEWFGIAVPEADKNWRKK